jgi:hypothetical protein
MPQNHILRVIQWDFQGKAEAVSRLDVIDTCPEAEKQLGETRRMALFRQLIGLAAVDLAGPRQMQAGELLSFSAPLAQIRAGRKTDYHVHRQVCH